MHKKLREIFNWFQQKAIRRMSLRNVLNEYYFRMDGSGMQPVSGASYKRQAVVYREKTIDDWIMSVTSATDPDDPRRGLLYRFYQSLYNDEHLQTTIDNRVLPVQRAEFNLVDDNGNEDEEAKKLLDRPWYHQLIRICFLHQMQGVSLADISHLDDNLEISHVEEVPMSNYIPQQMIIVKEESDKTGWSYKDGALEPYYVQFGNAWALGMLNELAVIILAKKLGLGSWMNYIEKYGIPPVFVTSDRQDKKRLDELFEMMQDFRNNFFAVLSGNEKVEYGKEAGGNTTNAFLPLEERCDNQISKRLLGQTGTTENGAWEGTAEIHERVEKSRHEYDKMVFQFYFNYIIIPKLVKISPVYKPLERLKLKWDDTESLSITEYIEAINKLAYTFEFDHEEVAKKTGLPIIGQKKNPGGEQQGGNQPNSKNHPNDESRQDNTQKKKSNPNKAMTSFGIAGMINSLYCQDEETPTDNAGFSLSDKIRDQILERLRGKDFDVEKDIDPDLFAHTFDSLSQGVEKGFGKVKHNIPDAVFLNELRHNCMVFAAFKTHRQQNELHALLFDEYGKKKGFDRFRKDTEKVLQDYNVNWLRTEYDTAVRRARFAADFRGYVANKDLYPNLEWLPSVSVNPREAHKIFYGTIRPVDDPFWNTNFPGNLWNCKCRVKSTDAPVNVKGKEEPVPPAPGLDKNPGITEEVFTGSHPYIKDAGKEAQEAVENFLNKNILNTVGNEKTTRKVTAIENEIRMNKSHETGMVVDKNGKIIIDKRGEAFQVQFTDSECLLMKDNIMTHNHPRGWGQPEKSLGRIGNSFSIEDLTLAVGNDVAEIRAVTPHYTFSMKRPKSGWGVTVKELKMVYMANELKLRNQFMKRIKKNTLTPSQANATHFHLLARQIAKQYNWTYEKKKTR